MRIFIGEASAQDMEVFGTDGLIENQGSFYSLEVEYGSNPGGTEDVVIRDGCGRSIPVSVQDVFALCKALSECSNINHELVEAARLQDFVENAENTAYICEHGHLHY